MIEIDDNYFKNYAGRGTPYQKIWKEHTDVDKCILQFKNPKAPKLKSVCVLGAATGEIPREFFKSFKIRPFGCEISSWAHRRIPPHFKRRIRRQDMRDYIDDQLKKKKHFDLAFSNSLVYLPKKDLPVFLKKLSRCCHFLHFNCSFKGASCPDEYRQTLESYKWWNSQFKKAGFAELKGTRGRRTYLWQSNKFEKAKKR